MKTVFFLVVSTLVVLASLVTVSKGDCVKSSKVQTTVNKIYMEVHTHCEELYRKTLKRNCVRSAHDWRTARKIMSKVDTHVKKLIKTSKPECPKKSKVDDTLRKICSEVKTLLKKESKPNCVKASRVNKTIKKICMEVKAKVEQLLTPPTHRFCSGAKTHNMTHPRHCTMYLSCNQNGLSIEKDCKAGLLFDALTLQCVSPRKAHCKTVYKKMKSEIAPSALEYYCRNYGAKPAMPKNEKENGILKQLAQKGNVLIGIKREKSSSQTFKYSDGSVVKLYQNWAPNSPSHTGKKACVEMRRDGTWKDIRCKYLYRKYICQAPDGEYWN